MVVRRVFRLELGESGESLDLEEDPWLLRLIDDPFEEGGACLDQERVLLELLLVTEDVNVLVDDLVVHEHRNLSHKVELSLNVLLFFLLVLIFLLVMVLFISEFLDLISVLLLILDLLLFGLLDLSLLLRVNCQNSTS